MFNELNMDVSSRSFSEQEKVCQIRKIILGLIGILLTSNFLSAVANLFVCLWISLNLAFYLGFPFILACIIYDSIGLLVVYRLNDQGLHWFARTGISKIIIQSILLGLAFILLLISRIVSFLNYVQRILSIGYIITLISFQFFEIIIIWLTFDLRKLIQVPIQSI